MAKNLKVGEEIDSPYGDVWTAAILVCDLIDLDFKEQTMIFQADIYKDGPARTAGDIALRESHAIDKATFLAEFDLNAPAIQLKSQAEDYVLTIQSELLEDLYSAKFE